ncbi:tripeptidyl peptidase SED3 [Eremomyces bilateralis CBS 781.70]|uniref:tripeptidyl-peptidase II n=1 Tax=Eremomyces bilateralis CBS 781.70 TaxID=1392243 RepID=A0A6G1FSB6_9PEZI|nr:tripeptidyl peptidase SED3 [Eremomyces bilateralis CBS 781.70]KAF1808663.1 tripeptidyl peptidase SED3 [Eremomyces bilateralis CBS 781.70]
MLISVLFSSFAAVLAGSALASRTSHKEFAVVESVHVPSEWEVVGKPEPSKRMFFRIALTKPNEDLYHQTLLDIATPNNRRYGQHLKRDELKALRQPDQEASDSVLSWLGESGISSKDIEDDGEWINFVATVSQVEEMLNTNYQIYRSTVKPVDITRTDEYSVPEDIRDHISMIQPTTRFGQIRAQRNTVHVRQRIGAVSAVSKPVSPSCNSSITPECLIDLYNIKGFTPKARGSGFVGVNGFLDQYARQGDLTQFLQKYRPDAANATFKFQSVNGGSNDQNSTEDSVEASLDIQYTTSLSYPIPQVFYSTPGRGPLVPDLDQPDPKDNQNEPWLEFFTYLTKLPDHELPHTLSTSYGEDEQSLPETYTKEVCDLIGGLGARGVSVLFSSGDTGVASACMTNDGKNTTRFLPIFPAACPYVTSVGGTIGVNPERAVYFSSGGFSDRFPRPKWQAGHVSKFLKQLGSKWDGLYNPEGRGFPDIAAQGKGFRVVDHGDEIAVGGTSASAPTIAGIVGLLNAARLEAGKGPLGFLNPWLYSVGYKGLTDIVHGGSTGCTGKDAYSGLPTPYVPDASWAAVPGWDPVTGLGTPDFGKLLELSGPRHHRRRTTE